VVAVRVGLTDRESFRENEDTASERRGQETELKRTMQNASTPKRKEPQTEREREREKSERQRRKNRGME